MRGAEAVAVTWKGIRFKSAKGRAKFVAAAKRKSGGKRKRRRRS